MEIAIPILFKNWDPDRHLKNDRRSRSRSQLHDRRSFGRSFYLHMLCQFHEKLRQQLANQKLKTFLPAFFEIVRKFEGYLAYSCKITTKIYVEKIAKKIAFFAIPIINFAIADRIAIFWLNDDRRSRSDRGKKIGNRSCFDYQWPNSYLKFLEIVCTISNWVETICRIISYSGSALFGARSS